MGQRRGNATIASSNGIPRSVEAPRASHVLPSAASSSSSSSLSSSPSLLLLLLLSLYIFPRRAGEKSRNVLWGGELLVACFVSNFVVVSFILERRRIRSY